MMLVFHGIHALIGKKIYLLSNAQRTFTEREIGTCRLAHFFDDIFISSDKLIMKYSRLLAKKRKKDAALREKMNYNEQMDYLLPFSVSDRDKMKDILERAGFSKKGISESEFRYANEMVEKIFAKK